MVNLQTDAMCLCYLEPRVLPKGSLTILAVLDWQPRRSLCVWVFQVLLAWAHSPVGLCKAPGQCKWYT